MGSPRTTIHPEPALPHTLFLDHRLGQFFGIPSLAWQISSAIFLGSVSLILESRSFTTSLLLPLLSLSAVVLPSLLAGAETTLQAFFGAILVLCK